MHKDESFEWGSARSLSSGSMFSLVHAQTPKCHDQTPICHDQTPICHDQTPICHANRSVFSRATLPSHQATWSTMGPSSVSGHTKTKTMSVHVCTPCDLCYLDDAPRTHLFERQTPLLFRHMVGTSTNLAI